MQNGDDLLTPSDVAKIAGVVPDTIRQWERIGRLPAIRTSGGMRLFRRSDVDALLERMQANASTAQVRPWDRTVPHE